MIESHEAIGFTCDVCGTQTVTKRGIINLTCLKQGCKGKKVIFDVDVMRRQHESDKWQSCPAGELFDSGYLNGTVTSGLYEVMKKDMYQEPVKEVPESTFQFEEKDITPEVVEEKESKKPGKKRAENPIYSRLKR